MSAAACSGVIGTTGCLITAALIAAEVASKLALDANGLTVDDVTWVMAHQANLRILEGVAERVGLPLERFFLNVERFGNTSSASVPTALDEAVEQGKIKQGDLLLMTALGGGLAWASAAVRW